MVEATQLLPVRSGNWDTENFSETCLSKMKGPYVIKDQSVCQV